MAVDLRAQIFQLREAGVSQRGIAQQLGISSSKVQRELSKRAPEVRAERVEPGSESNGFHAGVDLELPPLPPGADPLLAEERAQLEREQIALRRAQLRSQRLEADRRAQLLEHPEASQGNGLVAVILQAMDRQRDDTRSLLQQLVQRQPAPAAPPPAPSLTEQLTQWRSMAETIASFAPPKPPSSASDLDFVVAKEKLLQESQDIAARREAELALKREELQSELKRNEAVATAIEQFTPLAAKFIEMWFEERAEKAKAPAMPTQPRLPAAGEAADQQQQQTAPRPTLVQSESQGEVEGECPSCRTALAITGPQEERCPKCGATLVVLQGRIRVRMSDGTLWPPLQV